MFNLNLSATLNVSRLLYNPSLCLPHITVKSFDQLVLPFTIPTAPNVTIKGVVLDKDNCFAKDHDDKVWPEYEQTWKKLKEIYPKDHLLIVSNSAGTDDDINHAQAKTLESNTGINVLCHSIKKPGCLNEITQYFAKLNVKPNEIIVIGDRLFTDMLMANMMGSWGCWINQGVELSDKILPKLERDLYNRLVVNRPENPYFPPTPN
ncbi:HAD phosphatase, family IIIA [Candida albicans P57072]|uniref:Phosphatidylglycerophosphatase n=1 Tax=Candida albicans (strain SC5314 / ATCC MYA-2876) TaxID=237561 RepID=A0A1D8PPL4_CANAL|nr:phosphatidylglycerophosphatase [Candida albicans SC5314]KGQ84124.1 HAD phosphatase, family IIIA [Candida albicans P94015]KGQ89821.1 HAD phosphatase, family IIIA [Candida albicans GC75]KGR04881.1 HAD phosphatase, family IIIA [Candida albicans P57072]KGU04727.1 HAD phosphatase, family IIIA [Candida albicans P87]KHC32052.1 HAD phosphatase, family IIIA [Candida albicans P76055]KHC32732.1 HAD phosphatase, family IIIA [Candida albicans P76067]KHC47645.1 HAD phosphatase, family IIIA [Candida alb|eukprot:XP_019330997.1 phosphatidylglycerophosphatase [Candida albicans SC5314]